MSNITTLTAAAKTYMAAGLCVVPASRSQKCPVTTNGTHAVWKNATIETISSRWETISSKQDAMGLICGSASGGVEIIDFDHAGLQFPAWQKLIPPELFSRLVVEKSPSGGIHVGYRCDAIGGNQKISMPKKPATGTEWKAYIETRGIGGQCLIAPSNGYSLLQRSWESIPTISADDRDLLISSARSLSEYSDTYSEKYKQPSKHPSKQPSDTLHTIDTIDRPGDKYNASASYSTTYDLLSSVGWSACDDDGHVTRPGKNAGVSGSIDSRGAFYCFTSSDSKFTPSTAYSPFSVLAITRYGGDHSLAASALAEADTSPYISTNDLAVWESDAEFLLAADDPDYYKVQNLELPKLPSSISVISDAIANTLQEPVSIQTVIAGIYCVGAAIGKRVTIPNRGQIYYVNLWVALLRATGQNKSAFANLVGDVIKDANISVDTPNGLTMAAFLSTYGSKILPSKKRGQVEVDGSEMLQKRTEVAQRHALCRDATVLVVDEMRTFFATLLGLTPTEKIKNAQLLCSCTENRTVSDRTETNGWRVIGDPAINFLGLSQTDPYNTEMRSSDLQIGGLAGRIIPANGERLKLTSQQGEITSSTKDDAVRVLSVVRDFCRTLDSTRLSINYGSGPDPLGAACEKLEATPIVEWFRQNKPEEYATMRSKIIVQAAKFACIIAVAAEVDRQRKKEQLGWTTPEGARIDAAPWIDLSMQIVGMSHITNSTHEVSITPEQQQIDSLITMIKRSRQNPKNATNRSLYRKMRMRSTDLNQLLKMLVQDGTIVERAHADGYRYWSIR